MNPPKLEPTAVGSFSLQTTARTRKCNPARRHLKVAVLLLALSGASLPLRSQTSGPTSSAPKIEAKAADLLLALSEKAKAEGTVSCDYVTHQGIAMKTSSPEWQINLKLVNRTAMDFTLGNEMVVAQIDETGEAGGSFILHRGKQWLSAEQDGERKPYRTFLVEHGFSDSDGYILVTPGREYAPMLIRGFPTGNAKDFGTLFTGITKEYEEKLTPGTALRPQAVANVLVALPALIAQCSDGLFRFHPLVTLEKTRVEGDKSFWKVQNTEWFIATPAGIRPLLTSTRSPFVRVLAANWLVQANGADGFDILVELVSGKAGGHLLAATLALGTQWRLDGARQIAATLEKEAQTPEGIKHRCRDYLDALGENRGFKTLAPPPGKDAAKTIRLGKGHALAQRFEASGTVQLVGIRLPDGSGLDNVRISIYHEFVDKKRKREISNSFVGSTSGKGGWFPFQQVGLKAGAYYAVLELAEDAKEGEAIIATAPESKSLPRHFEMEGTHPKNTELWKSASDQQALATTIQFRVLPKSRKLK